MPPPVRTPREKWIEHGLLALAAGGPEAVRIDVLAQSLGVTRGGFYWQFADRSELLAEILDAWERLGTDEIVDRVEREGGSAKAKLRRTFALASSDDGPLAIDLAVRDWARRDEAVAQRLRRVDNRRMDYLRSLFATLCDDPDDVEARSMMSFSLLIGNHFIAADHGKRGRQEIIDLILRWIGS
jgi:AcrR family transcriptional regulator